MAFFVLVIAGLNFSEKIRGGANEILCSMRFYWFDFTDGVSSYFFNLKQNFSQDIGKKLFELQNENLKLRLQADRIDTLLEENRHLRELLSLKEQKKTPIIVAKVITVFNNDFVRSALINVGSKQGVRLDNFVYAEDGVVGRIIEVSENWSKVLLIVDANSNIPAKVGGADAMLCGDNSALLRVNLLNETIKEGDMAMTSSYGNVFQENIVIGKVIKVKDEYFVSPAVNFNDLKYVCVGKCENN